MSTVVLCFICGAKIAPNVLQRHLEDHTSHNGTPFTFFCSRPHSAPSSRSKHERKSFNRLSSPQDISYSDSFILDPKRSMSLKSSLADTEERKTPTKAQIESHSRMPSVQFPPSLPPTASSPSTDRRTLEPRGTFDPSPDSGEIIEISFEDLIVKITSSEVSNDLIYDFLFTYRSFTTPFDFLKALQDRFLLAPLSNSSMDNIQLKVIIALRAWVDRYWFDFLKDYDALIKQLSTFRKELSSSGGEAGAKGIDGIIQKAEKNRSDGPDLTYTEFRKPAPPSILPKPLAGQTLHLLDVSPMELARQLTITQSQLWKDILPLELVGQAWSKEGKESNAPHILAMIREFNQMSAKFRGCILMEENLTKRKSVLKHLLAVAMALLDLNNFNGVMEIISALQTSSVYRLKNTQSALTKNELLELELLKELVDRKDNYKNLRTKLKTALPPMIPYLGMYLTDLTFIEDGHPDMTPSGLINFLKRRQTSNIIRVVQDYQVDRYFLNPLPEVVNLFDTWPTFSEEKEYEISLYLEPRSTSTTAPVRPSELDAAANLKKSNSTLPNAAPSSAVKDAHISRALSLAPVEVDHTCPVRYYDPLKKAWKPMALRVNQSQLIILRAEDLKTKEKYPLNTICALDRPKPENLSVFEIKFYLAEENIILTFEAASVDEADRFAEVIRARIFTMFDEEMVKGKKGKITKAMTQFKRVQGMHLRRRDTIGDDSVTLDSTGESASKNGPAVFNPKYIGTTHSSSNSDHESESGRSSQSPVPKRETRDSHSRDPSRDAKIRDTSDNSRKGSASSSSGVTSYAMPAQHERTQSSPKVKHIEIPDSRKASTWSDDSPSPLATPKDTEPLSPKTRSISGNDLQKEIKYRNQASVLGSPKTMNVVVHRTASEEKLMKMSPSPSPSTLTSVSPEVLQYLKALEAYTNHLETLLQENNMNILISRPTPESFYTGAQTPALAPSNPSSMASHGFESVPPTLTPSEASSRPPRSAPPPIPSSIPGPSPRSFHDRSQSESPETNRSKNPSNPNPPLTPSSTSTTQPNQSPRSLTLNQSRSDQNVSVLRSKLMSSTHRGTLEGNQ